jgi:carboxyl-terminal processing protease
MRRWLSLNGLLVAAAALAALVLTVARPSPEGLINLGVGDREVRAAPGAGQASAQKHNLGALKIVHRTLIRIRESYVDPSRIDPKKMLYAALDSVQFNVPEVMVEADPGRDEIQVVVNDKQARFSTRDVDSPWRLAKVLKNIFLFIEANINPGADLAEVEYAAVNGMLSTLDPHSVLLDPEMAREMDINTSGGFGGLGIVIGMRKGKLTVISPMKNTPAAKAGIQAKDKIVKINDEVTENLTINEAVERMRGRKGTKVTLWIERSGEPNLLKYAITRAEIHVPSVESKLLSRNVGYIRLKQFAGQSTKEVSDALGELRKQGANRFVLDLRWNPGGLLEQSIQIADLFLDQGTIVTTVGGNEREPRRAEPDKGDVVSAPLAVLVNGWSASAAELVAGALKNLDRAIVIGANTFGKGSVQILYDNDDESKLKLTIAQYLTPGDLSIQSLGIVPDIELSRMYIPTKNQGPEDTIRLLPPSKSYREKDLKEHLDSTYAVEGPKPDTTLAYVYEPPAKKADEVDDDPLEAVDPEEEGEAGLDDDEPLDSDEFQMDYEIALARDVLAEAGAAKRKTMVKAARKLVEKRRAQEVKKLTDKLAALGVDWNAPAGAGSATGLDAKFQLDGDVRTVKAGQSIKLIGTVTNTGSAPAHRVMARIKSDDTMLFDDTEMVFGKIDPGKSRTWTSFLKVQPDAIDRADHLDFELRDASGAVRSRATPLNVRVVAADRPVFSYGHQLIDGSNGDGLIQPGESHSLRVTVKNTGKGEAAKTTAVLRNVSGSDLVLKKTRFELGSLKPGESKTVDFSFQSASSISNKEVVVEMMVYDSVLRESVIEKLKYPVRKGSAGPAATGGAARVTGKDVRVFEGASADSGQIAGAPRGSVFPVTGKLGDWLRLDLGGGRPGFVRSNEVSRTSGRARLDRLSPRWQVTPPALAIETPTFEVKGPSFTLKGKATDDSKIEDVYIFVSNQDAKIENRKVFYKSNRGAAKPGQVAFAPTIPLWPGSNLITVVARENDDVKSSYSMFLYRPATKAASAAR